MCVHPILQVQRPGGSICKCGLPLGREAGHHGLALVWHAALKNWSNGGARARRRQQEHVAVVAGVAVARGCALLAREVRRRLSGSFRRTPSVLVANGQASMSGGAVQLPFRMSTLPALYLVAVSHRFPFASAVDYPGEDRDDGASSMPRMSGSRCLMNASGSSSPSTPQSSRRRTKVVSARAVVSRQQAAAASSTAPSFGRCVGSCVWVGRCVRASLRCSCGAGGGARPRGGCAVRDRKGSGDRKSVV